MKYDFLDKNKILYASIVGAWGDMFASYAHLSLISRLTPLEKFNIIYYGYDPHIKTFLELQNNINSVIHIKPKNKEEYEDIAKESGNTESKEWLSKIVPDIDAKQIIPTHLNSFPKLQGIYIRNFEYNLPETSLEIPENSILFNPYSMQSVPLRGHWRFIPDALEWLIENTDYNIILIGQEKYHHVLYGDTEFPLYISHPKVTNLVGKTSMLDVLAIAQKCKAIITTSNSLSMWSIISNKPCIVMLNSMLDDPQKDTSVYYFKEWINCPPNKLLSNRASLEDFEKVMLEWKL